MSDSRRPQDKWRHAGQRPASGGAAPSSAGRSRTAKLFLGSLVLAGLVGVVVGLLFFLQPAAKPIFLSIVVSEYTDKRFPVNAWALQDGEALRKHFGTDSVQAFQSQERDLIVRELNQLADRSGTDNKGRPIIVHLSANAIVADGTVQIIPGNAVAGSTGTYLPLASILDPLRKAKGNRLLLLDLRPVVDVRLGLLNNNLDESVKKALPDDLPFGVIVACGPGSEPVVSQELRRSLFGWFLDQGLKGNADRGARKNERVDANEFLDFTREYVFNVAGKLDRAQLPAIHGKGADFTILSIPPQSVMATPQAAEAYPAFIHAGWKERDRWAQEGVQRRLPRTYRHFEAVLLRAEQQWLGGSDLTKVERELANELAELKAARDAYPEPVPPQRSLAIVEKTPKLPLGETKSALTPLLDRIMATPGYKMEDLAEIQKQRLALAEKTIDPAAAAVVIFNAAMSRDDLSIDQVKQLDATVRQFAGKRDYAETGMLRALTAVDAGRLKYWAREQDTIPLILLATKAAERAVAVDGCALPWLLQLLTATEQKRRAAFDDLLKKDEEGRGKAREIIKKELLADYGRVAEGGQNLVQAFTQLDESRVFLAGWAGFDVPDEKLQRELDTLWQSIVTECRDLQAILYAPPNGLPDVQLLKNKANDLQFRRERVLTLMKPPTNALPADLPRWLAWPNWSADQRRQFAETLSAAALPQVEKALQVTPVAPPASLTPPDHTKAALRRAKQALDLLSLADPAGVEKAELLFAKVAKSPDQAGLNELGSMVSKQWIDTLPAQYKQAANDTARERIGWVIHPFDLPAIPRSGDTFPRDAAAEVNRVKQRDFARFVADTRDRADAAAFREIDGIGRILATLHEQLANEQNNWKP